MQIGDLNRRIVVLEQQPTKDEYGGETIAWIPVGRVWANIVTNGGTEILQGQQVQAEATTKITVRFYAGLTVMHRIQYGDKLYEILGTNDVTTNHRWTEITAKEMGSDELQRKAKESQSGCYGCNGDNSNIEIDGGCSITCTIEQC